MRQRQHCRIPHLRNSLRIVRLLSMAFPEKPLYALASGAERHWRRPLSSGSVDDDTRTGAFSSKDLIKDDEKLGASEIAQRLGIGRASVCRVLKVGFGVRGITVPAR
jgi:hypothetical protein